MPEGGKKYPGGRNTSDPKKDGPKKKKRSFFQQMLVDMFRGNAKKVNERMMKEGNRRKRGN